MKYVTSLERYAMKKGLEEGRAKGLEEGRQEGRQEGLQEGRAETFGVALQAMALVLESRYGAAGLELLPALQESNSLEVLRTLQEAIRGGATLEKLRSLLG